MSTEAFNTMRKNLVESVTGSALDWLAYMGTDAALAAIPDTNPPRYVVAGTLADIVKLLPATEAFTVPPLTAPAPLTDVKLQAAIKWLNSAQHGDNCFVSDHYEGDPGDRCNCGKDSLLEYLESDEAAPAPQQSEMSSFFVAMLDTFAKRPDAVNKQALLNQIMWAIEDAAEDAAKAAPAAPVQRIPDMLTVETIQGAIAFGRMGINPPPSPDHWGNEFWQIGRQLAKLGETSAWDNVTPVDVAAPVQADQAQAEQAAAVRAAYENAARIAENFGPSRPLLATKPHALIQGRWEGEQAASANIAAAIRALAAPSTATSNDTGALGGKGAEA